MTTKSKAGVSWNSVKAGLSGFDRTALLGLVQDLYSASKDNQAFLHARHRSPRMCRLTGPGAITRKTRRSESTFVRGEELGISRATLYNHVAPDVNFTSRGDALLRR